MRSYKSIERPAQVLGMNLSDLGLMVVIFIGSVMGLGFLDPFIKIPRLVYLAVVLVEVLGIVGLRYLTKTQAPGFITGWLSYTFLQPRRLAVGPLPTPPPNGKETKNDRV